MADRLGELGFYTLAGHSDSPRDLVEEVREAEAAGTVDDARPGRLALRSPAIPRWCTRVQPAKTLIKLQRRTEGGQVVVQLHPG